MLTPDKIRYAYGVRICEKIIPDNAKATKDIASWVKKGQPMKPGYKMDPIGITVHNTNDLDNVNDDAEQYTRATYPNCNMGGVVVHYYVDDLGAWQNLREDESGWHASDDQGDGNRRTIAVEIIMTGKGSAEDNKAKDNAARLIAYLLDKYGWTINDLYTHNHWKGRPDKIVPDGGKNCPYYLLSDWDGFKKLVKSYKKFNRKPNLPPLPPINTSNKNEDTLLSHEDIKEGMVLNFVGNKQYKSNSSTKDIAAKSGKVKVTIVSKNKSAPHPIHVRSINESGSFTSNVYGWVDLKDLEPTSMESYLIRITVNALNIRSGPGTSYKIVSTIRDKNSYTIVEEKNGWGKLKSQIGWINLSYTEKV